MEGERDGDQVVHDIIELRVGVYYGYKEPPEGGGLFKELSPRRSFEDFADLPGRRPPSSTSLPASVVLNFSCT